jgi:hypothetical protein
MIRELPSAIRDIATLMAFGWTIFFIAHLLMGAA